MGTKQFIRLRPTSSLAFESCRKQYEYGVIGIKPTATGAAFPFGRSVHTACLAFVVAHARKDTSQVNPVAIFEETWAKALESQVVRFSTHDHRQLEAIGKKLCDKFPDYWQKRKLTAAITKDGTVLVEQRLRVMLDDSTELSGEADIVAINEFGEVEIPDMKTPSSASFDGFAAISDQLIAYQLLVSVHAQRLGLGPVKSLSFIEGLKKLNPEWVYQRASARTKEDLSEYVRKLLYIADEIRAGRFWKTSGAAFNTPCSTCDFFRLCRQGSTEGLLIPEQHILKIA